MADPDQQNTEAVTTYVPAYQKAAWQEQAADLEMSQAEFVRTMVQAGRKGFETNDDSPQSKGSNPRGEMEETVLRALDSTGPLSWAELVEEVTENLESQLESAILTLQESGRIGHRPRDGTYVLREDR